VIPELPELNSGFVSCYPKFLNKIRVSGISGSGSGILGSGFGLRVFRPALGESAMLPSEGAEHGVSSELLTGDPSGRPCPVR
jgi:hypothetical protein